MTNAKARKLQYLLITELLDKGSVELILPDGITLEIGIMQEDEFGDVRKSDDYCYVVATRAGKSALLDSYNLGLQYEAEKDTIIYEDEVIDKNGKSIKTLDIV
jgi:hypothetical protein